MSSTQRIVALVAMTVGVMCNPHQVAQAGQCQITVYELNGNAIAQPMGTNDPITLTVYDATGTARGTYTPDTNCVFIFNAPTIPGADKSLRLVFTRGATTRNIPPSAPMAGSGGFNPLSSRLQTFYVTIRPRS